jgi:hypothetical protein
LRGTSETGVCDSDIFVVIVASVALTDFFPKEACRTYVSVYFCVRHFGALTTGARERPHAGR